MTFKELINLTSYDSRVIIWEQNVEYFATEKKLIYISSGGNENNKGFDELEKQYGDAKVRLVASKDDFLEISIYTGKEED